MEKSRRTFHCPLSLMKNSYDDVIKRAVLAIQANNRQAYGAMQEAGERASARLSRRRRHYRGSYGKGISRIQRKVMSRRGAHINFVGAFTPGTRGGRKSHPPKASKIWEQKVNVKERRLAIRSAIAATAKKEIVELRATFSKVPIIIVDSLESLAKTKDVEALLLEARHGIGSCKNKEDKDKSRKRKDKRKKNTSTSQAYCSLFQASASCRMLQRTCRELMLRLLNH